MLASVLSCSACELNSSARRTACSAARAPTSRTLAAARARSTRPLSTGLMTVPAPSSAAQRHDSANARRRRARSAASAPIHPSSTPTHATRRPLAFTRASTSAADWPCSAARTKSTRRSSMPSQPTRRATLSTSASGVVSSVQVWSASTYCVFGAGVGAPAAPGWPCMAGCAFAYSIACLSSPSACLTSSSALARWPPKSCSARSRCRAATFSARIAPWIWGWCSPRSGRAGLSWVKACELPPSTSPRARSAATIDRLFRMLASCDPRGPSDRRRQPAVEVDRGARDVRRALGAEEGDEVRELVRLAEPAERHAAFVRHLAVERLGIALHPALPLAALHDAEADRVDPNRVGRVLVRERLGQVGAGRARHARGQRPRRRRLPADRRHVHDAPAATALHVRDDEAAESDRRPDLQVEVGLPLSIVHVGEARGRGRPGAVHEDVHGRSRRYHHAGRRAGLRQDAPRRPRTGSFSAGRVRSTPKLSVRKFSSMPSSQPTATPPSP